MKSTFNRNDRPPIYTLKKEVRDFVRRRTNETEKAILNHIPKTGKDLTATQFVKKLHKKTGKAKITLWYNLRKLRTNKILFFGDGGKLKLGDFGKFLLEKGVSEKNKSKTDGNGDRKC